MHSAYIRMLSVFASGFVATTTLAVVGGENGIETMQVGRYNHTYIKADSPLFDDANSESTLEILKAFVDKCKDQEPKNAVYIQLPDDKSALIALLRKSGFRYESEWYRTFVTKAGSEDREAMGQVWIVRNDSSVPAQPSFTHTGRVTLYTTVANDVYDPIGYCR
ncbi:hypothetical protein E6Q11_06735 [Candidatus Dojkabacteria bacterium]|uniref:Uncharacterized protein n=1 Tax=Candidatus Dojkabacteria bacterium TaxID=2099670 RepID=A0A5C7J3D7_9BACT|nr:MAG: hypothetical protein E6Q11_06735 [Candidatus Dojkabacteria bacterium]